MSLTGHLSWLFNDAFSIDSMIASNGTMTNE
jgi:hypothetical protein